MKENIELYAQSIVKNLGWDYEKAKEESIRWHNKCQIDWMEPLLCPYTPFIEKIDNKWIDTINGKVIIEYIK